MHVRITRSAETDLLEGYAFYEEQQTGIGEYFLDSLFADIDALALFAGIHPKPDGKLHRTLAKRSLSRFITLCRMMSPPSSLYSTVARIPRRLRSVCNDLDRRRASTDSFGGECRTNQTDTTLS